MYKKLYDINTDNTPGQLPRRCSAPQINYLYYINQYIFNFSTF